MLNDFQLAPDKVLRQEHNLPDVIGRVRHRSVQRLDDGEWLVTDVHGPLQIPWRQAIQFAQHDVPCTVPVGHQPGPVACGSRLELGVAIPIGLLAVARQEVAEP